MSNFKDIKKVLEGLKSFEPVFKEDIHQYTHKFTGDILPSVTTILGEMTDIEGLEGFKYDKHTKSVLDSGTLSGSTWVEELKAKAEGRAPVQTPFYELSGAAGRGTQVHSLVEDHINYQITGDAKHLDSLNTKLNTFKANGDKDSRKVLDSFNKFKEQEQELKTKHKGNLEYLSTELKVHGDGYAGGMDILMGVGKGKDRQLILGDLKTGSTIPHTVGMQTGAYSLPLEERLKGIYDKPIRRAVFHTGEKGSLVIEGTPGAEQYFKPTDREEFLKLKDEHLARGSVKQKATLEEVRKGVRDTILDDTKENVSWFNTKYNTPEQLKTYEEEIIKPAYKLAGIDYTDAFKKPMGEGIWFTKPWNLNQTYQQARAAGTESKEAIKDFLKTDARFVKQFAKEKVNTVGTGLTNLFKSGFSKSTAIGAAVGVAVGVGYAATKDNKDKTSTYEEDRHIPSTAIKVGTIGAVAGAAANLAINPDAKSSAGDFVAHLGSSKYGRAAKKILSTVPGFK